MTTTKALRPEHVLVQATPLWIAAAGLNPWSLESNELQPLVVKQHSQENHFHTNKTTVCSGGWDTWRCTLVPMVPAGTCIQGHARLLVQRHETYMYGWLQLHSCARSQAGNVLFRYTCSDQCTASCRSESLLIQRGESGSSDTQREHVATMSLTLICYHGGSLSSRRLCIFLQNSLPVCIPPASEHITTIIAFIKIYFLSGRTLNPILGLSPDPFTRVMWSSQEASLSQILLKYIFFNWLTELWHLLMSVFSFSAIWNAHCIITFFPQEFPLFVLFPHK